MVILFIIKQVKIGDEINILKQFIELQKLRSKDSDIVLKTEIKDKDLKISPLIFLPIIENGFKHGVKADTKETFLHIDIKSTDKVLFFKSINNKGKGKTEEDDKYKGIGLENIKRRLEISYPMKHEINIFDNDKSFSLELKLILDE